MSVNLVSTDQPTMTSLHTRKFHFDLPIREHRRPLDYNSVFRPSKMIKVEKQDLPISRYQKEVVQLLEDRSKEPFLYHKLQIFGTTAKGELSLLRGSNAPDTSSGRLSEADCTEPVNPDRLSHDRTILVPTGPKKKLKSADATSQLVKLTDGTIQLAFIKAKRGLQTCRNCMQDTRQSLCSRYENDPTMKEPQIGQKLSELDAFLRQAEDGLANALELMDKLYQN